MTETAIEVLMTSIILLAIVYEEKLIAFEDRLADRFAWYIAQIIVTYRRARKGFKPRIIRYKNRPKETLKNET